MAEIIKRKLSTLRKLPGNPRTISAPDLETLKDSLATNPELFDARPIILSDRTGELVIIAGNMRMEAARQIGMKEVPTILLPGLNEAKEREIAIRDNINNGDWDWDILANQWDDLPLAEWGLQVPTFDMDDEPEPNVQEDEGSVAETVSKAAELQQKWETATGQMWKLGEHWLMCGDSTDKTSLSALLKGNKIDLGMHDPPYGINATNMTLGSGQKDFVRVDFDGTAPEVAWLIDLATHTVIWGGNYFANELPANNDWLCWHKKNDGLSFSEFELAWTNSAKNCRHLSHHWSGEKKNHPTQKPLPVIKWAINLFEAKTVFDAYSGSGTTLIACEQTGRKCFAMELAPEYVAVTLERWHLLTGKEPELIQQ